MKMSDVYDLKMFASFILGYLSHIIGNNILEALWFLSAVWYMLASFIAFMEER